MIDSKDFAKAARTMHRLDQIAAPEMARAADEGGEAAAKAIRRQAPRRSGKLGRSIKAQAKGRGFDRIVHVGSSDPVARILVAGAKPHEIPTRSAKALALKVGRGTDFAAYVSHPGIHAQPFIERGIRAAEPDIDAALARAGDRTVHDLVTDMDRR